MAELLYIYTYKGILACDQIREVKRDGVWVEHPEPNSVALTMPDKGPYHYILYITCTICGTVTPNKVFRHIKGKEQP